VAIKRREEARVAVNCILRVVDGLKVG